MGRKSEFQIGVLQVLELNVCYCNFGALGVWDMRNFRKLD